MAYDEDLADRIRVVLQKLLRVDPAETDSLVREAGVTRFQMRGREMDGWVRVDPSAPASDDELSRWVQVGVRYAASLPSK